MKERAVMIVVNLQVQINLINYEKLICANCELR